MIHLARFGRCQGLDLLGFLLDLQQSRVPALKLHGTIDKSYQDKHEDGKQKEISYRRPHMFSILSRLWPFSKLRQLRGKPVFSSSLLQRTPLALSIRPNSPRPITASNSLNWNGSPCGSPGFRSSVESCLVTVVLLRCDNMKHSDHLNIKMKGPKCLNRTAF